MNSNLRFSLLASLTLGLAPFFPEPHLVGKLRWLSGGGEGMLRQDYLDLAMHGIPWLFLLFFTVQLLIKKSSKNGSSEDTKRG